MPNIFVYISVYISDNFVQDIFSNRLIYDRLLNNKHNRE